MSDCGSGRYCINGGRCREHGNDYSCDCTVGWKGKDCDIAGKNQFLQVIIL